MPESGTLLRIIAILLALAGYASFTWVVLSLFRRTGPPPTAMRWVGILGTVFSALQIIALLVRDPALWFSVAGIAGYTGSMALFWWAVPYARTAGLALAFTESQSSVLTRNGPYR